MSSSWSLLRSLSFPNFIKSSLRRAPSKAEAPSLPIYASCILARAPLIKPLPEDWEIEYKAFAQQIRSRREQRLPYSWEKGKKSAAEGETDAAPQWTPHSRITAADKEGDTKSLMRCLDKYLFFVVRSNGGWRFPSAENQEGETIRQTAERALNECLGKDVDAFFIANWPIAHVEMSDGVQRVDYYMKAQLLSGRPSLVRSEDEDHVWIAKHEIEKYFQNEKQRNILLKALP